MAGPAMDGPHSSYRSKHIKKVTGEPADDLGQLIFAEDGQHHPSGAIQLQHSLVIALLISTERRQRGM